MVTQKQLSVPPLRSTSAPHYVLCDSELTRISIILPTHIVAVQPLRLLSAHSPQHFASPQDRSRDPNPNSAPIRSIDCGSPRTKQTKAYPQRLDPVPTLSLFFLRVTSAGLPANRYRSQPWQLPTATRVCRGQPLASSLLAT